MNKQIIENMSTQERVLELIKVSSVLADRAKSKEKTASVGQAEIKKLIPGVVEACKAANAIRGDQQSQFADALTSHASTLSMLHKMATMRIAGNKPADVIGQPVAGKTEKRASANAEPESLQRLRAALKVN